VVGHNQAGVSQKKRKEATAANKELDWPYRVVKLLVNVRNLTDISLQDVDAVASERGKMHFSVESRNIH